MVVGEGSSGFDIYGQFIADQVEAEDIRKTSIESRAGVVITTSGAIITLLFGLAAVVTAQDNYVPPASMRGELKAAVLLFALAIGVAVLINLPLPYRNVKPGSLRAAIDSFWDDDTSTASMRTAATHVKLLYRAQMLNQIKGYALLLALSLEAGAVAFVALAVQEILLQGTFAG